MCPCWQLSKAKFTCSQASTRVDFPDGVENMLRIIFSISIADVSGPYANGDFTFFVEIPKTYPFHGKQHDDSGAMDTATYGVD